MRKVLAVALVVLGVAGVAMATPVPEIDPGSAGSAVALIAGALLMFSARRNK